MSDWLHTLLALRAVGTPAVVVTVASRRGSVPRREGTKMIVTEDAIHGTIGGGHLEHQAIAIARGQLEARRAPQPPLHRFPLGASLGQCCGGLVNLLFEPLDADAPWLDAAARAHRERHDAVLVSCVDAEATPGKLVVTEHDVDGSLGAPLDAPAVELARTLLAQRGEARLATVAGRTLFVEPCRANDFDIVLFGAGHVGRALVHALAGLPCEVRWVDEREGEFPREVPPNVTRVCTDAPDEEVDVAPAGAYFVVMTHSHALDEALAERILRRNDFAYFGLIGSTTKRRAFEKRMERRGMPAERFASMTCPIGIAGIPGKEPSAIAIAVAAQLLQIHAQAAAAGGTVGVRCA